MQFLRLSCFLGDRCPSENKRNDLAAFSSGCVEMAVKLLGLGIDLWSCANRYSSRDGYWMDINLYHKI